MISPVTAPQPLGRIPLPGKDGRAVPGFGSALTLASGILNEALMGFLALVALATAIGPLVFDLSVGTESLLNSLEGVILALFVAEFAVQFAVAKDRSAWLRSPWRIVDAVCIVGPLLSFLPQVSDAVRGALVFRFLRVGRAVAFGARAGALAVQKQRDAAPAVDRADTRVSVVMAGDGLSSSDTSWLKLLAAVNDPASAWYHASSIDGQQYLALATEAGIPQRDGIHFHYLGGPPRLKSFPGLTAVFLWLPTVAESGFPEVSRNRLLALVSATNLVTATSFSFDLPNALTQRADVGTLPDVALPVRMTYAILALLGDRNAYVSNRLEEEIGKLEDVRVNEGGARFLSHAFRLQREIASATADQWRLKGIVQKLADGKVPLPGTDARNEPYLDSLLTEMDGLYEHFGELKEALKSLIELHMNVTSFEMNKFMKLLAIVGFLGLIPSVAGGLLGMNVAGNPWSVTLGQVAFGIAMGMATSLYVFAIKGWLR